MTRTRALSVGVLAGCVGVGLFAEWASLQRGVFEVASGAGTRLAAADFVVGLGLAASGTALQVKRPGVTGLLLTAAAYAWFLGTFAGSGRSGFAEFGSTFVTLHRGPLIHALLSYPAGRVKR